MTKYVVKSPKRWRNTLILAMCILFILGTVVGFSAGRLSVPKVQAKVVDEVESTQPAIANEETPTPVEVIIPQNVLFCKLTAYCRENYPHICNNGDATNTATMTVPTPNRTVAVDPEVIPLGSKVYISGNDNEYIAEDTGGAIKGNRVDILFDTHEEALNFGVQYAYVTYEEPQERS